jgi:hypothetical protein
MLTGKILIYFRAKIGDSIHETDRGEAKKDLLTGGSGTTGEYNKALHGARLLY